MLINIRVVCMHYVHALCMHYVYALCMRDVYKLYKVELLLSCILAYAMFTILCILLTVAAVYASVAYYDRGASYSLWVL